MMPSRHPLIAMLLAVAALLGCEDPPKEYEYRLDFDSGSEVTEGTVVYSGEKPLGEIEVPYKAWPRVTLRIPREEFVANQELSSVTGPRSWFSCQTRLTRKPRVA